MDTPKNTNQAVKQAVQQLLSAHKTPNAEAVVQYAKDKWSMTLDKKKIQTSVSKFKRELSSQEPEGLPFITPPKPPEPTTHTTNNQPVNQPSVDDFIEGVERLKALTNILGKENVKKLLDTV